MRSCAPSEQALLGCGNHKGFVSPVQVPFGEGLRLSPEAVMKGQEVGAEAKQGGALMQGR